MNILVCNDDGIFSEGLITLANILNKYGNVLVVAPNGNRSGYAGSISFNKDVSVNKVNVLGDIETYTISGTPTDCVRYALLGLHRKIDLVVSGINRGSNLGDEIYYSGTVGACFEANFNKIPAIAFSLYGFKDFNFSVCSSIVEKMFEILLNRLDNTTTFNVNIPNVSLSQIKGVKLCPVGENKYNEGFVHIKDNVYQLQGDPLPIDENDVCSDVYWLSKKYVTITPLKRLLEVPSGYEDFNGIKF